MVGGKLRSAQGKPTTIYSFILENLCSYSQEEEARHAHV